MKAYGTMTCAWLLGLCLTEWPVVTSALPRVWQAGVGEWSEPANWSGNGHFSNTEMFNRAHVVCTDFVEDFRW